jgi:hypothetical protein
MNVSAILKSVVLALSLMSATSANAQTKIYYSYDVSGNRITRSTTVSKTRAASELSETIKDEVDLTNRVSITQHASIDMITVKINEWDNCTPTTVVIYNMSGYKLFQMSVKEQETDIDLSSYSVGYYILQVTIGENKNTWKIIKG